MKKRVHWCEDIGNLIRLAEALHAAGRFKAPLDLLQVFKFPWRYEAEWENLESGCGVDEEKPVASERLLTRPEAAEFLQVSAQFLATMAMNGEGPAVVKIGRNVRYRREDLRSWAKENRVMSEE